MAFTSSATAPIAPPSNLTPLINSLSSALSPNQLEREQAFTQLQSFTNLAGYHDSLVQIFSNRQFELGQKASEIKLQAALQFKNGVDRFWRRTAVNVIRKDEKASIRPRLLAMVDEPDRVLAKTVALAIGKIARLDYGTDWEELPNSLLSSFELGLSHPDPNTARLILHRALLYLNQTVKSLSSNRILRGRTLMYQITSIVFEITLKTHQRMFEYGLVKLNNDRWDNDEEIEEIELSLLGFKILAKLIVYGFREPAEDQRAKEFFTSSLSSFTTLFSTRHSLLSTSQPPQSSRRIVFLTKHIIAFMKLYRNFLSHDVEQFSKMGMNEQIVMTVSGVLQNASLDSSLISDELNSIYPERLIIHCLLLLRSTTGDWASASPLNLPQGFATSFAELLVLKLMPLRRNDLEKWNEDPEEWINEEESMREEFELRACAEYVMRSLISHYKEELRPFLQDLLRRTSNVTDANGMQDLLLKEGVYCAFGHSPADLSETINFDQWLDNTLIPEAHRTESNERIIRRRIAWLVGNWVGEDLQPETRTKIYSLLVHQLGRNPSTDPAIRLTAARSLAKCDTWDFDRDAFVPFLPKAIEEVVQLLGEVSLSESMMRLNQTLGVIVDRVGEHITPYAPTLAGILASLWSGATENHFQVSVLVTFTKLAEALGNNSQGLHSQVCPIIRLSADPSHPSHVYLQEDSLELWQALLKRSSTLSPDLIALLPLLVNLIGAGTDVLPRCLAILESYLLLDGTQVAHLCSSDLLNAFALLIGGDISLPELRFESTKVILHALSTLFQTAPIPLWAEALESSQVFLKLLMALRPEAEERSDARSTSRYLLTLARIVLAGPETFFELIRMSANRTGTDEKTIMDKLLTSWVDKLDNISSDGHRKLVALSLASLISSTPASLQPIFQAHFGSIISAWCSVLAQTEENDSGDAESYDYQSDAEVDYVDTLETTRRSQLGRNDPVRSVKLRNYIGQRLGMIVGQCGGQEAFSATWLHGVEEGILSELDRRLKGTLAG